MIFLNFLLAIWMILQDIVGFFTFLFVMCGHRYESIIDSRGFILTKWKWGSGVSLGHFIFVSNNPSTHTVQHEYGHLRQSRYLGPLYLFIIGIPSIIWAGCFGKYRNEKKVSYYSFYTEKWAEKLGGNT